MDNRFTPLEGDEVLSVDESVQIFIGHRTFRAGELMVMLTQHLVAQGVVAADRDGWFAPEGVACEALRFGSNGWHKGRVRLNLEFCPDEAIADLTAFTGTTEDTAPPADIPPIPAVAPVTPEPAIPEVVIPEAVIPETEVPIADVSVAVADEPMIEDEIEPVFVEETVFVDDEATSELDLGENLLANTEDEAIGDIFEDAPVDLSQDDAAESAGSSLVDQMVDDLVDDDDIDGETEDIFASAPIDLSDESAADDLFGESTTDTDDVFGGAVDELPDSEVNPFVETPEEDALSGLLDDADDIFADAPTDMSTPVGGLDDDDDPFATRDDDVDDIFGGDGELDLGGADATTELAVEDAEDLFGDDNDDAIDWGLDDEDETPLAANQGAASKSADGEEDDSVFADIWNDIDEMA